VRREYALGWRTFVEGVYAGRERLWRGSLYRGWRRLLLVESGRGLLAVGERWKEG